MVSAMASLLLLGPCRHLLGAVTELGGQLVGAVLELDGAGLELARPVIELHDAACQLRVSGGQLLGPVTQLVQLAWVSC